MFLLHLLQPKLRMRGTVPSLPYVFMPCWLIKHRDNFTFFSLLPTPTSPECSPHMFSAKNFICISHFLLAYYMYRPSYSRWCVCPNIRQSTNYEVLNLLSSIPLLHPLKVKYEGVSKSFRIGRLERELQMVQLYATRCSCIATLWVSLQSFVAITLLDTPSYLPQQWIPKHFQSMFFPPRLGDQVSHQHDTSKIEIVDI
jgi:hypothetical protein